MNMKEQINDMISNFATELDQLVRRATIETLEQALTGQQPPRLKNGNNKKPLLLSDGRVRIKGEKRDPEKIQILSDAVELYVKQNPGQGVEAMGRTLETSTKELMLPIKKLIASGKIRTEGHKRATKYFSGNSLAVKKFRKVAKKVRPSARKAKKARRKS